MAENKEGIHFTWFTGGNDAGIYYNNSKDSGKTFASRDRVSGKASKHCQITSLPNDNILIVWNESFPNGNTFSGRIGIEERDANGRTTTKSYLTPEKSNSSFPVIFPLNQNKAIIAYTENVKNKDKVYYTQVSLD